MKTTTGILIVFLCFSCFQNEKKKSPTSDNAEILHRFDWLIGDWERTNNDEGKSTYENWTKISKEEYRGLGFTISKGDTIFKEELKLFHLNSEWTLEVSGVNESPTPFKLINYAENKFVSENKTNEFPKLIEYRYADEVLIARISDESMEILFSFIKTDNQ